MLGLLAGAVVLRLYNIKTDWEFVERNNDDDTWRLLTCIAGGAFLGVVFWVLRHVKERKVRLGMSLVLGVVLVGGTILGTRLGVAYADLVPRGRLVATVRPLLERYRAERRPAEGFGDFWHRVGIAALRADQVSEAAT